MAQMADISADRLAWCTAWHLREDTLQDATNALVNFHHGLPLTQHWGGGTLSSSDGQRIPVAGKIRNATALPRYFRYQGVTYYSWTSDQLSQYGTKVIPATVRDATYVLDAILDNETELTIVEHATDTAGYTDIVFCLFRLIGHAVCPAPARSGRPATLSDVTGATGRPLNAPVQRDDSAGLHPEALG